MQKILLLFVSVYLFYILFEKYELIYSKYIIQKKNNNDMTNPLLKYENECKCNVLNGNKCMCINNQMFSKICMQEKEKCINFI